MELWLVGGGGAHPWDVVIRGDGPLGLDGQDEKMVGEGTKGSSLGLPPSMAPSQVGQLGDGGETDEKREDSESCLDFFNAVHLRLYPL